MNKIISSILIIAFLLATSMPVYSDNHAAPVDDPKKIEICLDENTFNDIADKLYDYDKALIKLQTIDENLPNHSVLKNNNIVIDEAGRVFSKEELEIRIWLPEVDNDKSNIFDYNVMIDPRTKIDMKRDEPTFWEKNDFTFGVVGGAILTLLVVFAAGSASGNN